MAVNKIRTALDQRIKHDRGLRKHCCLNNLSNQVGSVSKVNEFF
ncbi:hypothetical protein CHCC14821_2334 [Bacillus paralicheniformis]|nr:hypothetical protein CHCC14821_2334 [Bacillus paralicheniformis]